MTMSKFGRFAAVCAALATLGLGGSAIASADGTGGSGGYWDADGTHGDIRTGGQGQSRGSQGIPDQDGFQAARVQGSIMAVPQS